MFKVIIIKLIVMDTIFKYVIKNQNNTNNNKKKTSLPMWHHSLFFSQYRRLNREREPKITGEKKGEKQTLNTQNNVSVTFLHTPYNVIRY